MLVTVIILLMAVLIALLIYIYTLRCEVNYLFALLPRFEQLQLSIKGNGRAIDDLQNISLQIISDISAFNSNVKNSVPQFPKSITLNRCEPSNLEDIKRYVHHLEQRHLIYLRRIQGDAEVADVIDFIGRREGLEFAGEKLNAFLLIKNQTQEATS